MKPRILFVFLVFFVAIASGCSTAPRSTDIVIPPPPAVRY